MNTLQYLLLFASPVIGGCVALAVKKHAMANYKLVLSFSGAFLFTIVVLHLLPEVFQSSPNAGLFVLLGFFLQIILEQLTQGIEHGHFHQHKESNSYITALLIGLSLHSMLDGVPLSDAALLQQTNQALLYGICIHKIPEGFALVSILLFSNYRMPRVLVFLILFSVVAPVATLLGGVLRDANSALLQAFIAIAIGSFLHVSTTILFESESREHGLAWKKIFAILVGAGIAITFS